MNKTRKIIITITICVILSVLFFMNADVKGSNNIFIGSVNYSSKASLYKATNTYAYNEPTENHDSTYIYYDLTSLENNPVMSGDPQITVLTHGLLGNASHWSNNGSGAFAPDSSSLISQLDLQIYNKTGAHANIYWAKMVLHDSFKLYDLNDPSNIDDGEYTANTSLQDIYGVTGHFIIIFEAYAPDASNYMVYEEFNYMLSMIVSDIKETNGGILPKINLIGHSRGGLTNLEYALDHPDMVASVFSLGTPYFGSAPGKTEIGKTLAGDGGGLVDIVNSTIYENYYSRWIQNYQKYSHINYHALGGYSDTDFIFNLLINDFDQLPVNSDFEIEYLYRAMNIVKTSALGVKFLASMNGVLEWIIGLIDDSVTNMELEADAYREIINDISIFVPNIAKNHIDGYLGLSSVLEYGPYFANDLLVGLPSQLGYSSYDVEDDCYGFNTFTKCYRAIDYPDLTVLKKAKDDIGVVHNLETLDSDLISYILNKIGFSYTLDSYSYSVLPSGDIKLVNYLGPNNVNAIIIPSSIDSYTVSELDSHLFGNMTSLTTVTIPNNVERIGSNAFYGLSSLTTVNIDTTNSNLTSIGSMAFTGCASLSKFGSINNTLTFPNGLESIGEYAFFGNNFTNISINSSLDYIGEGAFSYNTPLSQISVNSLNDSFTYYNNCLYSLDGKLIQYAINNNSIYTSVANSINNVTVDRICASAFMGASNLTSISLGSVSTIGENALSLCDSITSVTIPSSVTMIENGAFAGDEDLGSISFNNNSLEYIGANAFAGCAISSISIPSSVLWIGDNAFDGCSSLSSVTINRAQAPITSIGADAFNDTSLNIQFIVPINRIADYKNNYSWEYYASIIVPSSNNYTTITIDSSHTTHSLTPYINGGFNKIYKIVVSYQNEFLISDESSFNSSMKLYDSNMELLDEHKYAITISLTQPNVYYLSINNNSQNNGSADVIIEKSSEHVHDYTYSWRNNTRHFKSCRCYTSSLEVHAVSPNSIIPGQQYGTCMFCGGIARLGIMPLGANTLPYTLNGSYMLSNGVIVLVDKDIEAYINGTLVFYHPNSNSMYGILPSKEE